VFYETGIISASPIESFSLDCIREENRRQSVVLVVVLNKLSRLLKTFQYKTLVNRQTFFLNRAISKVQNTLSNFIDEHETERYRMQKVTLCRCFTSSKYFYPSSYGLRAFNLI
jgi:hypothetical protein